MENQKFLGAEVKPWMLWTGAIALVLVISHIANIGILDRMKALVTSFIPKTTK